MSKKNEVIENVVMDDATKIAVIEDNMHLIPKGMMKKFNQMTVDEKLKKVQFYQDIAKLKEDARIKNSIPTKVKELFDKRHGTVEDARSIIKFAQEFIDNFNQREIERIDDEIAKLEAMKEELK